MGYETAAFGHREDPAADAIITLDRNQQLQHAALMSLLVMNLPLIAQNTSKGNGKIELPQALINALESRNAGMQQTAALNGLAAGNTPFRR